MRYVSASYILHITIEYIQCSYMRYINYHNPKVVGSNLFSATKFRGCRKSDSHFCFFPIPKDKKR